MSPISFQQILFIRQSRAALDAIQEAQSYTHEPTVLRKLKAASDLTAEAMIVFQRAATEVALENLRRAGEGAKPEPVYSVTVK